jgi:putative hydrolase of the HAD superfamily
MQITRGYRAIVFDLDDTLYPERDYVFSGFRAVSAWIKLHHEISEEATFLEFKQIFEDGNRTRTFDQWSLRHHLNAAELVPQLVQVYRDHVPSIQPFAEIPSLLYTLRTKYRLALLSDGQVDVQKRKLSALGIASLFDVIVFSDEWGKEYWKPNPRIFEITLERLGVSGREAAYVGDNPAKDFQGARAAGMESVRLRLSSGLYSKQEAQRPSDSPDFVVESLVELIAFFS